ncbi:Vacuolar protein-sorting-associated protein 27 [Lobosporangium transversale]|nr:Vacuolar protein-sorting-associated protein 27 [Lobosporangium transversale]
MSSWLRTTSAIDELVDKATSENLPAGIEDFAQNLEICDQIRSKQVSPKDAAKALKRRISHKNPNVQLLALGLTDACVKNGGRHFLVEVASREFIDNMVSILKTPAGCNPEVKTKILALLQSWGHLFRGSPSLGYVCDTYMVLQHEGYKFPPADNVGAALVETAAPPDWTDSDVCTRCRTAFTLTNRKHHCRNCGDTFCGQCSSNTMSLPNLGINQEVRVCDGCWIKRKMGGKGTPVYDINSLGGPAELVPATSKPAQSSSSKPSMVQPPNPLSEDEDLKRAIELSLKEVNTQPGYKPSTHKEPEPTKTTDVAHGSDVEDTDLLAAIEASLRETNLSGASTSTYTNERQSAYGTYTYTIDTERASVTPSNTLTQTEKENVELFASLVDRIQMMNGDVSRDREVQALYAQISKLQAKVDQSLEEVTKKQQEAIMFNQQIDQAVRIYDHLLQERLNSSYQQRMGTSNYGYSGLQQQQQQQQQGDFGATSSLHARQDIPVYPHLKGSEPSYSQPMPNAPYAPYSPNVPPVQHNYQYHSPQTPSTAPFVAMPFASAPPPTQSIVLQTPYQPLQDPYYASAPGPSTSFSPITQQTHQLQQQDYQTTSAQLPTAVEPVGHPSYTPFIGQPLQSYVSTAPAAPTPVVPVEEKPLIEL